jgi:hypothetical protein
VAHVGHPSYSDAVVRRITVQISPRKNSSVRPYLKKPFTKIGLVKWLKVKVLSLSASSKLQRGARHWWLMPTILANLEAEIRRITVQYWPGRTVL